MQGFRFSPLPALCLVIKHNYNIVEIKAVGESKEKKKWNIDILDTAHTERDRHMGILADAYNITVFVWL